MPILDVCFIARAGVNPPDDIKDALRCETGETQAVWEPYWHEVATLEAADTFMDGLGDDHRLTRPVDAFPVTDESDPPTVTGYRLRMAQLVTRPIVTGGWKLLPGAEVGAMRLYHVRADGAALLRLHQWMTEDEDNDVAHPATGALCVQDATAEDGRTMEADGVFTRLNKTGAWWTARKATLANYCEAHTTGDGAQVAAQINAAATEPQLLLALLKAAAPTYPTAAIIQAFWERW